MKDVMTQIAAMDKYYDELNSDVKYKCQQLPKEERYNIIDYQEALDTCNGDFYYKNKVYKNEIVLLKQARKTYREDITYFKEKISRFKKYFTA